MPGCFPDKVGHNRCFHVREGLATSGSTSEILFFVALRRAYGPSDTALRPILYYLTQQRVNGSALKRGSIVCPILATHNTWICPVISTKFCARFCPNVAAAYSSKSLPRIFPHVKTILSKKTLGHTRFCPLPPPPPKKKNYSSHGEYAE